MKPFHRKRLLLTQVDEMFVFTVTDSSRVDSFEIVVEEEGHNALEDLDGPMKVSNSSNLSSCILAKIRHLTKPMVVFTSLDWTDLSNSGRVR